MITRNYYSRLRNDSKAELPESWHIAHCLDYLRQSIMCCGDTALEGRATTFTSEHIIKASDGWGVKHVCKNYGEVSSWMEENRADDEVWI